MSPARRPTDLAASVRARLQNLARDRGEEFQRMLSAFAIERKAISEALEYGPPQGIDVLGCRDQAQRRVMEAVIFVYGEFR